MSAALSPSDEKTPLKFSGVLSKLVIAEINNPIQVTDVTMR